MASFEKFADKLLQLEGGYVNHPQDRGGPTKYGVILSTWKQHGHDKDGDGDIDAEDIKQLTEDDARDIAKRIFWDSFRADEIQNQSVAEFIVDWGYNSGPKLAAKKLQKVLNVRADGIVGPVTLGAINEADPESLFMDLKIERLKFIDKLVSRRPDQRVFKRGWSRRIKSFQFDV